MKDYMIKYLETERNKSKNEFIEGLISLHIEVDNMGKKNNDDISSMDDQYQSSQSKSFFPSYGYDGDNYMLSMTTDSTNNSMSAVIQNNNNTLIPPTVTPSININEYPPLQFEPIYTDLECGSNTDNTYKYNNNSNISNPRLTGYCNCHCQNCFNQELVRYHPY